ncbi:hypothetical protein AGMMS50268_19760 [Spirochaetia bacterium]|nr:hypothetical protein AGMMS50268_19760 [Spirochaetia bacterium]
MRFLKCEKQDEFEMIAAKNPQIEKAVGILKDLSADERTRLLEESHQILLKFVIFLRKFWTINY